MIQQNGNYKICIFDVELQQDIGIFDLPGYDANGLIIDDEKNMVFNVVAYDKVNDADLNSLYIIDLDDTTKLDLVYSCYDYYYNYNVYNGAVFVCTENGLKKFTDEDEIGRLGVSLNYMASRLDDMEEDEKKLEPIKEAQSEKGSHTSMHENNDIFPIEDILIGILGMIR